MAENIEQETAGETGFSDLAGKYLTFKLGEEDYGIGILKVQEIIKMIEITKMPRSPRFVRGVINLRGKIIPVVDLRLKFEMEEREETSLTCVIVVEITGNTGTRTMSIVVDEVSEVLEIAAENIEPPPVMGAGLDIAFILGMAKAKGGVTILLDADKILSEDELRSINEEV